MVALGISEFTFGYAFLHEQTVANWGTLIAAPILPSLQQEAAVGWDAHLPLAGVAYFYQFKIAEHLERSNASFYFTWTPAGPYFRIALHARNNNMQHRRLRYHCTHFPLTYYVAPEMKSLASFNSSFLASKLLESSRLVPLTECKDLAPIDRSQHYITFRPGRVDALFHSESSSIGTTHRGTHIAELYRSHSQFWAPIDKRFALDLLDRVAKSATGALRKEGVLQTKFVDSLVAEARGAGGVAAILQGTARLLSIVFGLTMVIVGERR